VRHDGSTIGVPRLWADVLFGRRYDARGGEEEHHQHEPQRTLAGVPSSRFTFLGLPHLKPLLKEHARLNGILALAEAIVSEYRNGPV
jgi:hypothetical protein